MNASGVRELQAAELAFCDDQLQRLVTQGSEVTAASLATIDGFQIASAGRLPTAAEGKLAAITSALQALGFAAAQELGLEALRSITVEALSGRMVALEIALQGRSLVLAVVADRNALLAHTLLATRDSAARIAAGLASLREAAGDGHVPQS